MPFHSEYLNKEKIQRLKCDNCSDWLRLEIKPFHEVLDEIDVRVSNLPILSCPQCHVDYLPDKSKSMLYLIVEDAKKKKTFTATFSRSPAASKKRFNFSKVVNFMYDSTDYDYIPGLARPWDEGFLTPVYFKKEILLKYLSHPEYTIDFASDTYGSIYHKQEHLVSFGVNRNSRVIMWLGDLDRLDEPEQYYLRSENIDSDHDIASHFYQGQIEAEFTDLSQERNVLQLRFDFVKQCLLDFNLKLSQHDIEVVAAIRDIVRPVVWTEKAVGTTIQALNKVFVESINTETLKVDLSTLEPSYQTKGLGGLKLLEKWVSLRWSTLNASVILCPFFVLYDFRVVLSQLIPASRSKQTLDSCYDRLDIPQDQRNYEQLYIQLMARFLESFRQLLTHT